MQREKLYNLQRTPIKDNMSKNEYGSYKYKVLFSQRRNLVAEDFAHFENKNIQL